MERFLFIDKDDVIINSAGFIQKYINEKTPYKTHILEAKEQLVRNAEFCVKRIELECKKAFLLGKIPKLGELNKAASNDIFRSDSKLTPEDCKYILYRKPIKDANLALDYAKYDKEMFLEARDSFLENDNTLRREHGAVDYDSIYIKENANMDVINTVNSLYQAGLFTGIYELSHHNGGREESAKRRLNQQTMPDIPFLGLRFHTEPQNPGVRRGRSSKALYVKKLFNFESLKNCYLIDDSQSNIEEWIRQGGKGILYRPITKEELAKDAIESFAYPRLFHFSEEEVMSIINELEKEEDKGYSKVKA